MLGFLSNLSLLFLPEDTHVFLQVSLIIRHQGPHSLWPLIFTLIFNLSATEDCLAVIIHPP